jgi:hypothetical protein
MSAQPFIPGLRLSELLFEEAVRPILAEEFPGLCYSAALIGPGSEVLGFDTPRSTDHNWGPRLLLFVSAEEHATLAATIRDTLSRRLPPAIHGFSTHFGPPGDDGARSPEPGVAGAIDHRVEVQEPRAWFTSILGVDPLATLTAVDWLLMPQQALLEVTAGRIFHDGLGVLEPVRAGLAYYPRDVWLYLLAAQWTRISQQEPFVGRTGEVGDELGSALIAAMLVHDLMALAFLLERRYAPYSKWFGTAFAGLGCVPRLAPLLHRVLRGESWPEREEPLCQAYELMAGLHNSLGVTAPVDPRVRPFFNRPFQVLDAWRFGDAAVAAIVDPEVRALHERVGLIGGIDQISDNVDLKSNAAQFVKLRALYDTT